MHAILLATRGPSDGSGCTRSLVTFTGRTALQGPSFAVGCSSGWGQVPIGCSAQTGGDMAAHYRESLGAQEEVDPRCISAAYSAVCVEGDSGGVVSSWVADGVSIGGMRFNDQSGRIDDLRQQSAELRQLMEPERRHVAMDETKLEQLLRLWEEEWPPALRRRFRL